MQDFGKKQMDEKKRSGIEIMNSPVTVNKVEMLNKRIVDLASEVRKEKVHKWNTRIQDG